MSDVSGPLRGQPGSVRGDAHTGVGSVRTDPCAAPDVFAVEVLVAGPGPARIVLRGELDLAAVPAVQRAVEEALDASADVVVDLAGLTFLDCAGLRAVLAGLSSAHARGGALRVLHPTRPVLRVLELTGTGEVLGVARGNGAAAVPHRT